VNAPQTFLRTVDHSERTRATLAMLDRHEAIRRRAERIVDRVLPAIPQPNHSTRYGELNGTMEQYARWEKRCTERNRLRNSIRDRLAQRLSWQERSPSMRSMARGLG
jgi:hypothetical protein